ncbi:hypothetical protein COOONC_10621 [Cooperia oncophora]
MVDYDDYKTELLSGLKLARQLICENAEKYRERMKVQVQFDHLLKVSREIDDTRLTGLTQRGRRGKRRTVAAIYAISDTTNGELFDNFTFSTVTSSSTNVRHIDWNCPGEMSVNGQRVACSVNVPISNLLPAAPLSSFAFRSPYELARVLAVISQTHVPEHFRLARMLDFSYDIVTPTSLGIAISFYRSHCIHMTLATVEDAGKTTPGYPPRSNVDPYNLPSGPPRRTLVVLPEGFQDVLDSFESALMSAKFARARRRETRLVHRGMVRGHLDFAVTLLRRDALEKCLGLMVQAVAKGAELVAVLGPKDDQNGGKTVDILRDLMEETVAQRPSLRQRIRCLLPLKSEEFVQDAPYRILSDKMNPRQRTLLYAERGQEVLECHAEAV